MAVFLSGVALRGAECPLWSFCLAYKESIVQNFKTCPHCNQNAVLDMVACRRCGYVYPGTKQINLNLNLNLVGRPQTEWDVYCEKWFMNAPKSIKIGLFLIIIVGMFAIMYGVGSIQRKADADLQKIRTSDYR